MENKIILKDIINILNGDIELYMNGLLVGYFTKEELKGTESINNIVCGIETDEESNLCVYLFR